VGLTRAVCLFSVDCDRPRIIDELAALVSIPWKKSGRSAGLRPLHV